MGHPTKASWEDELVDRVSHSVFQGRSSRGGFPSSPVRGGRRSIVLLGAYCVPYVGAAPGGQESKGAKVWLGAWVLWVVTRMERLFRFSWKLL